MPIALVIAVAAHVLLLFGLNIKAPASGPRPTQTLELMVVTESGVESVAEVSALVSAQTDRAGETQARLPEIEAAAAGSTDSNALDGADAPSKPPAPSPLPEQASAPAATSERSGPPDMERALPPERAEPAAPPLEALPAPEAVASRITATSVDLEAMPEPATVPATDPPTSESVELDQPQPPPISAADIFASRNAEMTSLAARIEERSQAYASRTRRKAISTATREYLYANYMEAWRRKVERIGNLNYPREARELGLFGSLILHVAVRADGSLEGIRVVRSSGHKVLDQAAVRIVELAAPFAPFPPNIKQETDVLDITRTWQFQRNHELSWGN